MPVILLTEHYVSTVVISFNGLVIKVKRYSFFSYSFLKMNTSIKNSICWSAFVCALVVFYIINTRLICSQFIISNRLYSKCKALLRNLEFVKPVDLEIDDDLNVLILNTSGSLVYIDTKQNIRVNEGTESDEDHEYLFEKMKNEKNLHT